MARTPFQVEVLTPEGAGLLRTRSRWSRPAPAPARSACCANHAPLMAILEPTELRLYKSESDVVRFAQGEGYLQVVDNEALVLVEEAIAPEDVDKSNFESRLQEARAGGRERRGRLGGEVTGRARGQALQGLPGRRLRASADGRAAASTRRARSAGSISARPTTTAAKAFYTGLFGWEGEDFDTGDAGLYTIMRIDGKDVAARVRAARAAAGGRRAAGLGLVRDCRGRRRDGGKGQRAQRQA